MRIAKTLMSLLLLVGCLLGQDPRRAGRQDGIAALGQGVYKSMREAEVRKQKKEIQKNLKALEAGNLVECTACAGTGYVKCDACSGLGYEGCSLCSGQGSVGYGATAVRCTVCNGNGKSMHDPCKGTGREACSRCDGTGNLGEAQKQSSSARADKAQPQQKQPSKGGGGAETVEDLFLARRYEEAADLAKKKLLFEPKNTELKIIYFYSLLNLGELDAAKSFVQQNRQTTDKYINATIPKMELDIGVYEGIITVEKLIKESFEKFNPAYMEKAIAIPTLTDLQRLVLKCNLSILKGDFEQAKKDCEELKPLDAKLYKAILGEAKRREDIYNKAITYINNFKSSSYAVQTLVGGGWFQQNEVGDRISKLTQNAQDYAERKENEMAKLFREVIKFNIMEFIHQCTYLFISTPFAENYQNDIIFSLSFIMETDKFVEVADNFATIRPIVLPCFDSLNYSFLKIDKNLKFIEYQKTTKFLPSVRTAWSVVGNGKPAKYILESMNFKLEFSDINKIDQSAKNNGSRGDMLDPILLRLNNSPKLIVPAYIGMFAMHYQYGPSFQKNATKNIGALIAHYCKPDIALHLENPNVVEDGSTEFSKFMQALGDVITLGVLSNSSSSLAQQNQARNLREFTKQGSNSTENFDSTVKLKTINGFEITPTIIGYQQHFESKLEESGLRAIATYKFK